MHTLTQAGYWLYMLSDRSLTPFKPGIISSFFVSPKFVLGIGFLVFQLWDEIIFGSIRNRLKNYLIKENFNRNTKDRNA